MNLFMNAYLLPYGNIILFYIQNIYLFFTTTKNIISSHNHIKLSENDMSNTNY